MKDLEHLVETERVVRRGAVNGFVRITDVLCTVVVVVIIGAGGMCLAGVLARGAWECVKGGWNLF